MAFPVVNQIATQAFSTTSATRTVNIPAVSADDLILIVIGSHQSESPTIPSGWTSLFAVSQDIDTGRVSHSAIIKKATGSEATVDIVYASSNSAVAAVFVVSAWSGLLGNVQTSSTTQAADGSPPDSPELTASWGVDDNLWLSLSTAFDDDVLYNGYPYTNNAKVESGKGANNGCSLGVAHDGIAAGVENPGAFSIASTQFNFATTVVIKPGTSGQVDDTPDQYTYTDITEQELSTVVESNAITVTGVASGVDVPISVTGGEYARSTDSGSTFGAYTATSSNVRLNDQIKLRHTTSASNETVVSTTSDIGGVTDTFSSTTKAAEAVNNGQTASDKVKGEKMKGVKVKALKAACVKIAG